MTNPFKLLVKAYYHFLASPETEARHKGVKIGKNCFIKTRDFPTEPYLIEIGDDCQITKGCSFHTHGGCHAVRHIEPKFDVFGKIKVGNGVYIGSGSRIMPGVTIGDHCLIAAGSIVTHSIPCNCVVGGGACKNHM